MATLINATLAGEDVKVTALDRPSLARGARLRLPFLDQESRPLRRRFPGGLADRRRIGCRERR
jgi:hypothetical protein